MKSDRAGYTRKQDIQEGFPHNPLGAVLDPERLTSDLQLAAALRTTVESLPPREAAVLEMRFWEEMDLKATGRAFEVGRERIRQIEARGLRMLKHPSRHRGIKPFLVDAVVVPPGVVPVTEVSAERAVKHVGPQPIPSPKHFQSPSELLGELRKVGDPVRFYGMTVSEARLWGARYTGALAAYRYFMDAYHLRPDNIEETAYQLAAYAELLEEAAALARHRSRDPVLSEAVGGRWNDAAEAIEERRSKVLRESVTVNKKRQK